MHKNWEGMPIVIFGSEGISRETLNIIEDINRYNNFPVYNFLGFIEDDSSKIGINKNGYRIISSDQEFEIFATNFKILAVVIPLGTPKIKQKIYDNISFMENLIYPNIIHPTVNLRESIKLGFGNIITAGVRMTTEITIGNFNLLNLNCTVGHDVIIKDYCVINPLASISGNVLIENNVLVGTGANILQNIKVHSNSIVGAGAVAVKDVEENSTVFGIPASVFRLK